MKRKKIVIILTAAVLVAAIAGSGIFFALKNSGKPVRVAPAGAMNNGYWNENSDIAPYGNVTTNLNQEIRYDESLVITDIYVNAGDSVQVGDPLIAYDTTLVSLELEMKEMQIEGIGLNIRNVQAELDQLRKTKPVAFVSPSRLAGMALASGEPGGSREGTENPTEAADPAQQPLLPGTVYGEITVDCEPYKGSGTKEDPYRYYVFPKEGERSVTIESGYMKAALEQKQVSVFDTVDAAENPTKIVSSWTMDFDTIMGLIGQQPMGTPFPENLKGKEIYSRITTDSVPYNGEDADGSYEKPYCYLCAPGTEMDSAFLSYALEEGIVCRFEAVDRVEDPEWILYSWTLDGKNPEKDPGNEDPGNEDPGEDPGNTIPDIQIPSGPTREELKEQIREKEETLKSLELDQKTAQLELKQLKNQVDNGIITSTVDGTVKSVLDEETAKMEGSPLITVAGEEGFYITGYVSEMALDQVEKGMGIVVTSWSNGMTYDASVTSVGNSPVSGNYYGSNPNMSYYPFTAVIKGDAELVNGDGVELSVDGMGSPAGGDVLYLSQAFVREENNQYYVYKKGENGRLTKQYVEAGKIVYGSIEIKSGLGMEEEIAFPYGKDVKEGARTESVDTLYNYEY